MCSQQYVYNEAAFDITTKKEMLPVDRHPVHPVFFVEEGGVAVFVVCRNYGLECVQLKPSKHDDVTQL